MKPTTGYAFRRFFVVRNRQFFCMVMGWVKSRRDVKHVPGAEGARIICEVHPGAVALEVIDGGER